MSGPVSEREFDLAIKRIEEAIDQGTTRLENLFKEFDERLRVTERSTTVQMWFWKLAGGVGLVALGAYLKFKA